MNKLHQKLLSELVATKPIAMSNAYFFFFGLFSERSEQFRDCHELTTLYQAIIKIINEEFGNYSSEVLRQWKISSAADIFNILDEMQNKKLLQFKSKFDQNEVSQLPLPIDLSKKRADFTPKKGEKLQIDQII